MEPHVFRLSIAKGNESLQNSMLISSSVLPVQKVYSERFVYELFLFFGFKNFWNSRIVWRL